MESIEIIDLMCVDTKWCHKKENVVDEIISNALLIIRMEEALEMVSKYNNSNYLNDIMDNYQKSINRFQIDLLKKIT